MINKMEEPVKDRSTGRLSAKQLKPIIETLKTSRTLAIYDMERTTFRHELKFTSVQMLTILLYMEIKKLTFAALDDILNKKQGQIILRNLEMPINDDGRFIRPSNAWISTFRNEEYPKFRLKLEQEIREMLLKDTESKGFRVITIDSTPLESSRYSCWTDYNGHYRIKMAKAHIIMMNGIPFLYSVSRGNTGDNPAYLTLLEKMPNGTITNSSVYSDGGYDSCEAFVDTYLRTGKVMNSNEGSNSVFHKEATWDKVLRRYNKLHDKEGFIPQTMTTPDRILRFMAANEEREIVGWYLRNLDILRGKRIHEEAAKRRHVCETVHHAMKRWVNFDVRGLNKRYAGRRVLLRMMFCTFLSLLFAPYEC